MTTCHESEPDRCPVCGHEPERPPRLSKRHKLVLAEMRFAASTNGKGLAPVSIADLMRVTGLSQASCAFARHDLLRWGLIERVDRASGTLPPVYRVLAPESEAEFLRRAGATLGEDRPV